MSRQIVELFFIVLVFAAIPGPSNVLAFRNGAAYPFPKALTGVLGHLLASYCYLVLSFSIIDKLSQHLNYDKLSLASLLGYLFLLYFGLSLTKKQNLTKNDTHYSLHPFILGFMFCAANPKVIIFYSTIISDYLSVIRIEYYLLWGMIPLIPAMVICIYTILGRYTSLLVNSHIILMISGYVIVSISVYKVVENLITVLD